MAGSRWAARGLQTCSTAVQLYTIGTDANGGRSRPTRTTASSRDIPRDGRRRDVESSAKPRWQKLRQTRTDDIGASRGDGPRRDQRADALLEAVEPVENAGSVPDEKSQIFIAIAVGLVLAERLLSDRRRMPSPEVRRVAKPRRGRRILGIAIGSALLWGLACGESGPSVDTANGRFAASDYTGAPRGPRPADDAAGRAGDIHQRGQRAPLMKHTRAIRTTRRRRRRRPGHRATRSTTAEHALSPRASRGRARRVQGSASHESERPRCEVQPRARERAARSEAARSAGRAAGRERLTRVEQPARRSGDERVVRSRELARAGSSAGRTDERAERSDGRPGAR